MIVCSGVAAAQHPDQSTCSVTWLGTASFLIRCNQKTVLIDPGVLFLPHLTAEKASLLRDIDLILVTHADTDHMNRLKYIPNVKTIPIVSTQSTKERLDGLNVLVADYYEKDGICVRKMPVLHGLRHSVDHTGFEIQIGDFKFFHLGDGTGATLNNAKHLALLDESETSINIAFITIGGIEANIENAIAFLRDFQPEIVIPMHWQLFFQSQRKAARFHQKVNEQFPNIRCIVPVAFEPLSFNTSPAPDRNR